MTLYNLTNVSRAGDPGTLMACTNDLVGGLIVYGFLLVLFSFAFIKVAKWQGAGSGFVQASFYTMLVSIVLLAAQATLEFSCSFMSTEGVIVTVALFVISLIVKKIAD